MKTGCDTLDVLVYVHTHGTHIADAHAGLQTSAETLGSRSISLGCVVPAPPFPSLIWVPSLSHSPAATIFDSPRMYSLQSEKSKQKDFLSWWNMQNLGCVYI